MAESDGDPVPESGKWAICCSGGGIRSASFCLGGLQRLQQEGLLDRAEHLVSVSGGGYIAAAHALVTAGLDEGRPSGGADPLPAYAPGTPEERHLRNNTRYLVPNGRTLLLAVLSQFVGVLVTFAGVLAPVFAFAHAWGWLLNWRKVLTPVGVAPAGQAPAALAGPSWGWTWWGIPAALGLLALVLFARWWLSSGPAQADRRSTIAKAVGWLSFAAAASAVAMLAVPALLAWLSGHTGPSAWLPPGSLGLGLSSGQAWATLAGLAAAAKLVASVADRRLRSWHLLSGGSKGGGAGGSAGALPDLGQNGIVAKAADWIWVRLLPWLATIAIVALVAVAALIWVRAGVMTGFSVPQLIEALAALAVMAAIRVFADVNRISMHDFYRWRLSSAFEVTRDTVKESASTSAGWSGGPADGALRAHGSLLSGLSRVRPRPVICATANISAAREVPVGRGGVQLTFDPEQVCLRGQDEAESAVAATADYERLVGPRHLTLFDLAAISGAAVSPLMGAMTVQAYRILFTMTNVRLGVWLPHPAVVRAAREVLTRPDGGATGQRQPATHWWNAMFQLMWYMLPHGRPTRESDARARALREARLWAYVLDRRTPAARSRTAGWASSAFGTLCYRLMQPTLGLLWAEAVGHTSYRSTWLYATDGGHYDDLGLVEALRRGADNVVVLDGSGDKAHTWFGLGGAVALARADAWVDIDVDPTAMLGPADGENRAGLAPGEVERPWAVGAVRRLRPGQAQAGADPGVPAGSGPSGPGAETVPPPRAAREQGEPTRRGDPPGPAGESLAAGGTIWLCKLGWWQGTSWDVRAYAAAHADFPGTSTAQQLYDCAEFDAYRELGVSAVGAALADGGLAEGRPPEPMPAPKQAPGAASGKPGRRG